MMISCNTINQIKKCQKCGLCKNQEPVLDNQQLCQIIWVGLSAKKIIYENDIPLSPNTNTGKLIQLIENTCNNVITYKTNLVKCLPLNERGKLRYPNTNEIECCFDNLLIEINHMHPKIIFLLGDKVYNSVEKKLKIHLEKWNNFNYNYTKYHNYFFVPIHHPSYIYVYKKKNIDNYIQSISNIINYLL